MAVETSKQIHFHYLKNNFTLKNRKELKNYIAAIIADNKKEIDAINIIFCSDEYLLEINRSHLNHNFYTDIITFELSSAGAPILSDIYISIDRIKENAGLYHSTIYLELHRVIFHGILHLCGYKDKSASEKAVMREKEDLHLNRYFVPRETK